LNGYKYYSLDQYNLDGLRHIAIINDPDNQRLVIGFEDLYNLGDQDYNDAVFTFTANPYDAIDTSKIPTGSPEAGPVATALIGLVMFGLTRRRSKRSARVVSA
jgi:MYXO-CTERM domain-containing protein